MRNKMKQRQYRFNELSETSQINAAVNFAMAWLTGGGRPHNSIENAMEDLDFCDDSDRPDNEIPKYTKDGEDA